jgi:hypothetical protein
LGAPDFVATLRAAIAIADETGDDQLILAIVNSTSPGWSTLPGVSTEETMRLLARALDVAGDDATRSRLLARVGADFNLRDPNTAEQMLRDALVLARATDDPVARLDALQRHASALLTHDTTELRRREVDEALPLAVAAGDAVAQFNLLGMRVIADIQLVDVAAADRDLAAADALAAQHEVAPMQWSVLSRRAWRAAVHGRLVEAERLVEAARAFGMTNGFTHAEDSARLQLAMLRWQEGRAGALIDDLRTAASERREFPGLRLILARALAADHTQHAEARQIVLEYAARDFDMLPRGMFWSSVMVSAAECAMVLDLPPVGRLVLEQLSPYVEQVAFPGVWVAGPIAHGAAVAAAASSPWPSAWTRRCCGRGPSSPGPTRRASPSAGPSGPRRSHSAGRPARRPARSACR